MSKRPVLYSKQERKNGLELSPRLVRRTDNANREVLGQVSTHIKRKRPQAKAVRLESPLNLQRNQLNKINEHKHILSEEQIRNSSLYRMLEQEINELSKRQEEEIEKLRKDRLKEAEMLKKEEFNIKLNIWELKNKVLNIKTEIQSEELEIENLVEQLRPYDSEEEVEPEILNNEISQAEENSHGNNPDAQ